MTDRDKKRRRAAFARMRTHCMARAWCLLAMIPGPLARSRTIKAVNGRNCVEIIWGPVPGPANRPPVGQFFSPAETLIVDRLRAATGPMTGPQIAKACGMPYEGSSGMFKGLLRNLVDRECLTHTDGVGYALQTAEPNNQTLTEE